MLPLFTFVLLCSTLLLTNGGTADARRKSFRRLSGSRSFVPVESLDEAGSLPGDAGQALQRLDRQDQQGVGTSFRTASHDVYLWPSLSDTEKATVREAFHQIHRRTCIRFSELDYKPWYHAERWAEGKPYVVIRKSKKFSGYSDNNIEDVNRRSLLYLSEKSLNSQEGNSSRGMVMEQLLKFMGFREEFLRPDAPSYIQPLSGANRPPSTTTPKFSNEQLINAPMPFLPNFHVALRPRVHNNSIGCQLTIYCQARQNADIGAGQRAGVLTRWDSVKLNSMYCPQSVGFADPRMGPCIVPRKPKH